MNTALFEEVERITKEKRRKGIFPAGVQMTALNHYEGGIEELRADLEELERAGLVVSFPTLNSRFYAAKY